MNSHEWVFSIAPAYFDVEDESFTTLTACSVSIIRPIIAASLLFFRPNTFKPVFDVLEILISNFLSLSYLLVLTDFSGCFDGQNLPWLYRN